MNKHKWLALILALTLCLTTAGVVLAASSTHLPWSVLSGGGGQRSSTGYRLGDTTGQPAIGLSQSSNYNLEAGFWSGATVTAVTLPGDANGDGQVNALDITKVERIIAGLDASTPGADANQDSNINALDITKVERLIAGLD